jgi:hypothetical protein
MRPTTPSTDMTLLYWIDYSRYWNPEANFQQGKVARWACSEDLKSELPWSSSSQFKQLIYELESWKASLPERLQYDLFTLHSHNAVEQGQAYCYMHCIHFMSYMFLHRAYLPVLGPQQTCTGTEGTPTFYDEHRDMWRQWEKSSRKDLFKDSVMVLEMLEEMRTFGVYFLRGLVPWIGFTIYTAVGAMLYSFNFPSGDDDPRWQEKARRSVIQGCNFLKEMKSQWPMAETWVSSHGQERRRMLTIPVRYHTAHASILPLRPRPGWTCFP